MQRLLLLAIEGVFLIAPVVIAAYLIRVNRRHNRALSTWREEDSRLFGAWESEIMSRDTDYERAHSLKELHDQHQERRPKVSWRPW